MNTFKNINDTLTELTKFPFLQLWYLFNNREGESGKSRIVISLIAVFLLVFGFALTFVHLLAGSLCFAGGCIIFGTLGRWHNADFASRNSQLKDSSNSPPFSASQEDPPNIEGRYDQDRKITRLWVGSLLSIALTAGTYYATAVGGWVGFLGWGLIPSLLVVSVGSFIINALADKLDIDAIEAAIKRQAEIDKSQSSKNKKRSRAAIDLGGQKNQIDGQTNNQNGKLISYQDLNIPCIILCGIALLGMLAIAPPLLLAETMWLMPLCVGLPLSMMVSQLMKTEQENPDKVSRLLQVFLQAGLLSGAMYLAAPFALVSPMTLVLWGSAVIALHTYLSFHSENIWSFLPWALAFLLPLFLPMSSAVCLASGLFAMGVWLDQRPWVNSNPESENTLIPIGFIMFFSPVMMFTLVNVFPVLLTGQWGICAYLLAVGMPFIGSWWREWISSNEDKDLSRNFVVTYMPLTFALWFVHPLAFYMLFGSGLMMIFELESSGDAQFMRMLWSLCFTSVWGLSLWLGGASSLYWLWLIVPILIVGFNLNFETGQQKNLIGLAMLTLALALAPGMPISVALGFSQLSAGWMFLHGVICFVAGGLSLAMQTKDEIRIVELMIALMALPMGIYLGAMPGWGVSLVFSTAYFWLDMGSMGKKIANKPGQIFNQFLTIGATSALFAGCMWLWPITNMWALIGLGIGLAIFNGPILALKFQDSHSASISYFLLSGLVLSILFPVSISCTMICGLLLPNVLVEVYAEWKSSSNMGDQKRTYSAKSLLAKVLMTALAIVVPIAIAPGTELSMLLGLSTQWYIGIMIAMGALGFAVQLVTMKWGQEDKPILGTQNNNTFFNISNDQSEEIDMQVAGSAHKLLNNLGGGGGSPTILKNN
ncbi:hypothetical protein N9Y17_02490 [Gammaproteobacteria bacterium]|nr:hypothetical protein [Gammaproteobacteria bacterium]